MAADSSFRVSRNGKVFVKASEMVNPNHIVELVTVSQAADPPLVSCVSVVIPAIQRVAPELTGGRKTVRRAAGDG